MIDLSESQRVDIMITKVYTHTELSGMGTCTPLQIPVIHINRGTILNTPPNNTVIHINRDTILNTPPNNTVIYINRGTIVTCAEPSVNSPHKICLSFFLK